MHDDAFADVADTYDDWYETPLGGFVDREELAALGSVLENADRGRVLEIGAGTGRIVRFLAEQGFGVAALEPSLEMRQRGERATAGLHVEWLDGYAEALPFEEGTFDGAAIVATVEFVNDPGRAIEEALRVVRGGGWLLVGFLHALSPWTALYRHEADAGTAPWTSARFFVREELEALAGDRAVASACAAWLAPAAEPPFDAASEAGRRAGNAPAFEALLWRKPS